MARRDSGPILLISCSVNAMNAVNVVNVVNERLSLLQDPQTTDYVNEINICQGIEVSLHYQTQTKGINPPTTTTKRIVAKRSISFQKLAAELTAGDLNSPPPSLFPTTPSDGSRPYPSAGSSE